ncbi:MAG: hypothetical protein HAW62_01550 [Endozoicomonadaceae bacterium]|nr:hypothetical protein [Endozoicomonadaceae bacterium]
MEKSVSNQLFYDNTESIQTSDPSPAKVFYRNMSPIDAEKTNFMDCMEETESK